jgi:phenylacetate-CoA ligase
LSSGEYLTTIFDDYPDAVVAFQVHQAQDYSITIRVVPNRKFQKSTEVIEQVRKKISLKACGQVNVTVKLVDNILSDRGKTRYVISDVN